MAQHRNQQHGPDERPRADGDKNHHASRQRQASQRDADNLKEREYRDAQENVHHHTKSYMEQHGKSGSDKS